MNPDAPLVILTALADFLLKMTFAFAVVWSISRLVDRPDRRFLIWLSFLAGAGTYWIWLAIRFISGEKITGTLQHAPARAATLTPGAWQIPASWALSLNVALRGAGILYLVVLSYFLVSHIREQMQLRWVLGFGSKPPIDVAETFQGIAESLQVHKCRLLLLTGITSPATLGWIRPTVLLPTLCLEQDSSELQDVLRHELHHVRRRDFLFARFAAPLRALLFFHPAVWYAFNKIQFERELACDLAVVSESPARRVKYAECLIRFARLNVDGEQKPWGVDFASPSVQLTVRVHSILTGPKKSSKWLLCLRATSGIVILVGSLTVLPSLAVVLSYVQQRIGQPQEVAFHILHRYGKTRTRAAKKGRLSVSSEPTEVTAKAATVDEWGGPVAQLMLDPPKSPEVVYAPTRPTNLGQDTAPDSGSDDRTSNSSGSVGGQHKPGTQRPTLASIIIGAARNIPWGDHDHDHDDH
jgi:beta-lactamase regulating signal transducer with metallopeptidase domain